MAILIADTKLETETDAWYTPQNFPESTAAVPKSKR